MKITKIFSNIGITLSILILMINPGLTQDTEENEEQSEQEVVTQTEEGNDFNQTIEDIEDFFQSIGEEVDSGIKVLQRFDRELQKYYKEYDEGGIYSAFCTSFVAGGCPDIGVDLQTDTFLRNYLENELGIDSGTISFIGNFIDVDLENGRISARDFKTIAGNLLGIDARGEKCPFSIRIIAGGCTDDTRLPVLVSRAANKSRSENLGSGDLRPLSQPTHLLLNEYTTNPDIEPGTKIELANLYDREIARSVAYGFVEQRGQEWLGDNLLDDYLLSQESDELFKELHQLSVESLNLTVTQDVMKAQSVMDEKLGHLVLNQTMMGARNHASLLSIQQENAYSLQVQANISDSLDRMRRAQSLDSEAMSFKALTDVIYLPGFRY